jgi:hypothetical protein
MREGFRFFMELGVEERAEMKTAGDATVDVNREVVVPVLIIVVILIDVVSTMMMFVMRK